MSLSKPTVIFISFVVSVGIALSGYFVGDALKTMKASERIVSVKGLAEREVQADLAIWWLNIKRSGNDLALIQQQLERDTEVVNDYLQKRGLSKDEIILTRPAEIKDHHEYGVTKENALQDRYQLRKTITLRTQDIPALKKVMSETGQLLKSGIIISNEYSSSPDYTFTGLNKIKPDMIAEATRNARAAANKFAQDSGSSIGTISSARQGFFSIDDRDSSSPDVKRIRVVTTLSFFIVD